MKQDIDSVKAYYDDRINGKLQDFTDVNPRIEAAIEAIEEWAPPEPKRLLEIGCGIGATSWRVANRWPNAKVIGVDVSPASIEAAKCCFESPNLSYREGIVRQGFLLEKFDFIVLMDVYEHIALKDREGLLKTLKSVLAEDGRIFFSVPTPYNLQKAREIDPSVLQPVDEDVTVGHIIDVAGITKTTLLYYREVGIWAYGDFAHFVKHLGITEACHAR